MRSDACKEISADFVPRAFWHPGDDISTQLILPVSVETAKTGEIHLTIELSNSETGAAIDTLESTRQSLVLPLQ